MTWIYLRILHVFFLVQSMFCWAFTALLLHSINAFVYSTTSNKITNSKSAFVYTFCIFSTSTEKNVFHTFSDVLFTSPLVQPDDLSQTITTGYNAILQALYFRNTMRSVFGGSTFPPTTPHLPPKRYNVYYVLRCAGIIHTETSLCLDDVSSCKMVTFDTYQNQSWIMLLN